MTTAYRRRRQKGETLLLTLLALLILYVGFLFVSSQVNVDAKMTGNTLAHQADVQVADYALAVVEAKVAAAAGGIPLEFSANNAPFYQDVLVSASNPAPAPPDLNYWRTCSTAAPQARCESDPLTLGNKSYVVSFFLRPNGRQDQVGCGSASGNGIQLSAVYYDIFMNIAEAGGVTSTVGTSSTIETVYRLCVS